MGGLSGSLYYFSKLMKKIILSFLASLLFTSGFAQKVTLRDDIVYKDDAPYCRLVKQGSSMAPRISISSIDSPDVELIVAQFNNAKDLYVISFMESGAVAYRKPTIGIAKLFAEDLVYNRVVVNGKVTPQGEQLLLRQYEGTTAEKELIPGLKKAISGLEDAMSDILAEGPPAKRNADNEGGNYETVERNHTRPVTVMGNKIMQDFQEIGQYTASQTAIEGKVLRVISISLPGGEKVAEATLDAINPSSARMVILKNNQVVNLPITTSLEADQVKKLAAYLAGRFLL